LNVRALRVADGTLRAPWRLLFFAGALVVTTLLATVFVAPVASVVYRLVDLRSETFAGIIDVVSVLAATWLALRWLDRRPWSEVGLQRSSANPRAILSGLIIGAVAIGLPIVVLILSGWLRSIPTGSADWGRSMVRMTVLLLPAAFAEELLTRGYLLTVLRDAWNWPWAVAVTSVAFGLLHIMNAGADFQSVALVTLAGVFLAVIRIVTGSLYAAWAAHFAWNWTMAAIFHAAVSGYSFDAPAYRYVDAGPDWATGGPWGPEGGIPAGLAMIIGTGMLLLWLRRGRKEKL
jgi:membrane protease YdiL (CAAX protease family)